MSSQIALYRKCIVTLVTFVWFFSTVSFYMSLQSTWKRRKKVALVTFVRLFTKMSFQMNSQMACLLFPFSIVSCQMFSQIACSRGCKNTLVTFLRLFSIVIVKFFSSLTQISICIFNFHCSICQIYTQQTNKCTKWTQNTIKVPPKKCDTKKGYHQYPIVYPIPSHHPN